MTQKPKGIDKLLKRIAKGSQGSHEEQKLRKRASQQRRASRGKQKRKKLHVRDLDGDLEELEGIEKLSNASDDSLDEWVRTIEGPTPDSDEEDMTQAEGLVTSIGPGWCRVESESGVFDCDLSREIASTQRSSLAVGDRVLFDAEAEPNPQVSLVLPRSSLLSRSDPGRKNLRRAIVANVELVVVVASAKTPPLHPKLFDRYLVAIESGGTFPLLCVNKCDLASEPGERAAVDRALEPYRRLGIPAVVCSASTAEGLEELRRHLAGKLCAFVGHSGVGKSSVLAAICPTEDIDTGDVSLADGKGRHTTTTSCLYSLDSGARVIDTPGIREFGLVELSLAELKRGFPEIVESGANCRFSDCSHIREPNCAVQVAVEEGSIDRGRYESWVRLLGEVHG